MLNDHLFFNPGPRWEDQPSVLSGLIDPACRHRLRAGHDRVHGCLVQLFIHRCLSKHCQYKPSKNTPQHDGGAAGLHWLPDTQVLVYNALVMPNNIMKGLHDYPPQIRRNGFTMIELLVVVSIIAVLAGLLIPAISMVRERSKRAEAQQTVCELMIAFETYRQEGSKIFPTPFWAGYDYSMAAGKEPATYSHFVESDDPTKAFAIAMQDVHNGTVIDGVLTLLLDRNLYTMKRSQLDRSDADGRLLDPWGNPYHYRLRLDGTTRTALTCVAGKSKLSDWNWDAAADREARRSGRDEAMPIPFAYVYSWGASGTATDARPWIYQPDGG